MNFIKENLKNKKLLFCRFLIISSILFTLSLLIMQPKKMSTYYPYEYSEQTIEEVTFPIVQHFYYEQEDLRIINLFFKDDSINDYDYQVDIIGEETENNYYSHKFENYGSNIMNLALGKAPDKKDKHFILKISCDDCQNVIMSTKKSNSKKNYIEKRNDNKVLEFNLVNYINNYDYYWYPIVGIVISLMLYPLAKEEK
ncbi:MAG: hypothetical protein IKF19_02905 [Bacilli bacterium]|nr:hypothetical protein [Bacilli bacterium]